MSKPKVLLTDFDGVIRHWPQADEILIDHLNPEQTNGRTHLTRQDIQAIAFEPILLRQAVCGLITHEQWQIEIRQRCRQTYPFLDAKSLQQCFNQPQIIIDFNLLDLYQRLRDQGTRILLITNATKKLNQDLQDVRTVNLYL